MIDTEILRYAVWGAEATLAKSIHLKERMSKNGLSDSALERLIKKYQNHLGELKDMLEISTSVEVFNSLSSDSQKSILSDLLQSING